MHLYDGLRSALQSIASHKMRSLLTTIGIVIGVTAVVTMFSSVYALKSLINQSMEGLSWQNSVTIYAGAGMRYGSQTEQKKNPKSQRALDFSDYMALKEELEPENIYAMVSTNTLSRVGNKDNNVRTVATENAYFKDQKMELSEGSLFNKLQELEGHNVAILGSSFAQEYYPNSDAIGQILTLGKHRYQIIGIVKNQEDKNSKFVSFGNWEKDENLKAVYVPLVYGVNYLSTRRGVHSIYLQAKDTKSFGTMKTKARQVLLSRHNMYMNFTFSEMGSFMSSISDEIEKQMKKWNITLSAIASISLLVGGVGLFSTLLISIQERMTEIGVRKSVGATEADIFFYFITEALMLAALGALVGIMIAWLMITLTAQITGFPMFLPIAGVALGLGFSLLIGFISGLYPALKASKTDPIKAIFYFD